MKKNIILLLCMVVALFSNAQTLSLPIDFETSNSAYFTDFGGNMTATGVDPTDPNNTVAISNKPLGSEVWAGATVGTNGLTTAVPLTASATTMSVRVYSSDAGVPVMLKLEDLNDASRFVETLSYTTRANTWETLVFDFSNHSSGSNPLDLSIAYNKVVIFFNFGTDGNTAGDKTYYWDDVAFGGTSTTLAPLDLPVTFQSSNVSYALVDFQGNNTVLGPDPTNAAQTVAISTRATSSSTWAGTVVGTRNGFANTIPFTTTATKMTARVYSPATNIPVLLKVEVANDPTKTVETLAYTSVANSWEILEWNFLQHVPNTPALDFNANYNLAAIFFNFGTDGATAGEQIYYWDNVAFGTLTNTNQPIQNTVKAYPNPVTDYLQLEAEQPIQELMIFNSIGQLVYTEQVNNNQKILNLSKLTKGIYFINVRTDDKFERLKIVKQ